MSHTRYIDVVFSCIYDAILARTVNGNIVVKISRVLFVTGGENDDNDRREPALTTRRRTVRSMCVKCLLCKRLTFPWNIWTFRDIISNTFRRPFLHVDINHAVFDFASSPSSLFLYLFGSPSILEYENLEILLQNIDRFLFVCSTNPKIYQWSIAERFDYDRNPSLSK